jgi:hypothetical protein
MLILSPQADTPSSSMPTRGRQNQDTLRLRADTLATGKADSLAAQTEGELATAKPLRVVPNSAWDVGEELTFTIRYGPMVAGSATMAVQDTVHLNGRPCYHIRTEAKSNKFFSSIYMVRDVAESFVDLDGLFPWRFHKRLREGKFRADRSTTYDQHRNLAITGKDTLKVPPFVQDVISTLYFLRTQPFVIGDTLSVANHADRKVYDLKVKVHGKERVRVGAGVFDCLVVEPFLLDGSGVFKHEGRILLWISEDKRHIPVQMKSKVVIGSVTAELEEMKGVKKT